MYAYMCIFIIRFCNLCSIYFSCHYTKTFASLGKILVIFSNYFLNTWMMLSCLFNEVNIHVILKLFIILIFLILQIPLIEPTKLYTCFTARPITKTSSRQQGNDLFSRGSWRRTQGESCTLSLQLRVWSVFLRCKGVEVCQVLLGQVFMGGPWNFTIYSEGF